MGKEVKCKECGLISINGTNFCSKRCKVIWKRKYNYTKKDWKKIEQKNEDKLIKMSGGIDINE